ncbi:arsenate reductase family protein [Papillibacter cinnamivorans]|uniref:Arsenate reductase, glutaredoxin family n=1 Tax=Papillibacter cinnamivorans DSM 12816 TaxID=1122930 RepID=A0A1W1ZHN7_9FIRM|nr:arsenate reductase family protein [Papillibacter cinnamivorans]SMC47877.1 Arsenate reductase, glutaredoxin family [Papillibacter cinnamivorans DSM 12816]
MNIQIFGSSKSFDSKKAERWFKERGIRYQYIDLPRYGMSRRELESVRVKVGLEELINRKSREYEELFIQYITPGAAEEKIFENPGLLNVPIVRNGREATVGYRPEIWNTWY